MSRAWLQVTKPAIVTNLRIYIHIALRKIYGLLIMIAVFGCYPMLHLLDSQIEYLVCCWFFCFRGYSLGWLLPFKFHATSLFIGYFPGRRWTHQTWFADLVAGSMRPTQNLCWKYAFNPVFGSLEDREKRTRCNEIRIRNTIYAVNTLRNK